MQAPILKAALFFSLAERQLRINSLRADPTLPEALLLQVAIFSCCKFWANPVFNAKQQMSSASIDRFFFMIFHFVMR